MSDKKLVRIPAEVLPAELPKVPEAFRRADYDGFLEEAVKRFQLKAYEKTQAQRHAVLRQINQIQSECLALVRNEADWRHFKQEDRIRQKGLDIQELELSMRMEELQESRIRSKESVNPKPLEARDPIQQALIRLRRKLRSGVEARSECDRLKEEYPDHAEHIEREFRKMIWDLREEV